MSSRPPWAVWKDLCQNKWLGRQLSWWRVCLVGTKLWVGTPALLKLGVVMPACVASTWVVEVKDQMSEFVSGSMVSFRSVLVT